jgi:predicted nucleotide-binding protein (sugar kinase/HSP70/actin superfamily)
MKQEHTYIPFTEEMKKDYTILVPNMLPMHIKLIIQVLQNEGYDKIELLESDGPEIAETGLKYTHNDTCYPAILVIGQFIHAIQSGKYDPNKIALIMFQTGGGCRASNYIYLIRKALAKAGYGHVPVISMNLKGLERHPGFQMGIPVLYRMFHAILCADLLMSLVNQCRPYEITPGQSEALAERYTKELAESMKKDGISFKKVKKWYKRILADFAAIPRREEERVRVGVVGEIYVKFSPLGNNNLNDFLMAEGAEVVVPGLLDFFLYCLYNSLVNYDHYGLGRRNYPVLKFAFHFLSKKQQELIDIVRQDGHFRAATPFAHTIELTKGYIDCGVQMGEGWLLPAEMLELSDSGVKNIVCTQPFGCLPNHICGKGMMKPLKDRNPDMNIVAIDYDAGASRVNQENRIKLMLANAREMLAAEEKILILK